MLIRAHAQIIHRGVQHLLWIVGDGTSRIELETLVKQLGVERSVTLWGYQENPYPFIKYSDFTACSSRYEGLHLVSMESLVLGKPVVSCCNVVEEFFGGKECGQITANDEEAFTKALFQMLTNDSLLEYRSREAQKQGAVIGMKDIISKIENVFSNLYYSK